MRLALLTIRFMDKKFLLLTMKGVGYDADLQTWLLAFPSFLV